jgi:glycosyltransferase involved in cell wall biosynthesis
LKAGKRVAILSPVAWRTPPRQYGAWETVAGNVAEGLVARGWEVTLFATGDSLTSARLHSVVERGYEEDRSIDPKVAEYLHIPEVFEHAAEFDLIHSHYDFMALAYSRLVKTPMVTTIHGFSSTKILPVYRKYSDGYFVSISNSDRMPGLNYVATVYNGIDLSLYPFQRDGGDDLIFLGRIHPDKGVHLAIEVAQRSGRRLIIAGIVQDAAYFEERVKPHLDGVNIRFLGPVDVDGKNEDGVTGFLASNVREAAECLERVPQIDRSACRRRVEECFSMDTMVEQYERVYSMVLELDAKKLEMEAKRTV